MATWEPKMPSFHETSMWSLKSADTSSAAASSWRQDSTEGAMSDPLSKSLLNALNTKTSSSTSRQFAPAAATNDNSIDTSYQNDQTAAGGGGGGGFNFGSRMQQPSADTKTIDFSVTSSTIVAPTPRGGASAKASKKRARASRKPPTTVLEADSSNFRAMVQQLTGIPALPFLSSSLQHHHQSNSLEFLDLVRPSAKSLHGFGAAGLPPLDPSSLILNRGPQQLHSDQSGFASPYFKYMSAAAQELSRQAPSMGDFLRTPLDELGLDQNGSQQQLLNSLNQQQESSQPQQQQQQQLLPGKLEPSMPLLWDGNENPRDLQLDDLSKYKRSRTDAAADEGEDITDQDGAGSRMAHIVDSWLSHADTGTDNPRTNNAL